MALSRTTRVNLLLGNGHFLSHFYSLCLPPLFLAWQTAFHVSFAELGLAVALMSGASATLQTPVGFLVDRYGARPFLIGGALLMSLCITAMGFATSFWQILVLAPLSGMGNSVLPPGGLRDPVRVGRQGPHGPRVRAAHVQRQPGLRCRAAGHGAAGDDAGLARRPDHCRTARCAGRGVHHAAERHPEGPGPPRARACGSRALRPGAAAEPHHAAVLRLLPAGFDGRRRRAVLADHHSAHGEGHDAGGRVLRAHRLHGRLDRRRAGGRLVRRYLQAACAGVRRGPDDRLGRADACGGLGAGVGVSR